MKLLFTFLLLIFPAASQELSPALFQTLKKALQSHPGMLQESDFATIQGAILEDKVIDPAEEKLLEDLVQPQLRTLNLSQGEERLTFYSASGPLRQQLEILLASPLQQAYTAGGYVRVLAAGKPESQVLTFLRLGLADIWKESSLANAYRPFREVLGKLYTQTNNCPDPLKARQLLFRAAQQVDSAEQDRIPDYLYTWVVPKE